MIPRAIQPADLTTSHCGMVITRDHPTPAGTLRKGHVIALDDLEALAASGQSVHAVVLEADDLTEAMAVPRIASAITGANIVSSPLQQGRMNLRSTARGLLRIDLPALLRLNTLPEIGVFTHTNNVAVNADRIVAGVKIGPVAMSARELDTVLDTVTAPVVDVLPFRPLRVRCLVSEQLGGRVRDRFERTLRHKIAWYGGDLDEIMWLEEDADRIATALQNALATSDLVLTAGSHMMDPLDATLTALETTGAHLTRLGAPAHPGSMVWLAHHPATRTPILSLASCSMFSRSTVADLLLPSLFAGEEITAGDIAALGHGGLLDHDTDWRFPPYGELP